MIFLQHYSSVFCSAHNPKSTECSIFIHIWLHLQPVSLIWHYCSLSYGTHMLHELHCPWLYVVIATWLSFSNFTVQQSLGHFDSLMPALPPENQRKEKFSCRIREKRICRSGISSCKLGMYREFQTKTEPWLFSIHQMKESAAQLVLRHQYSEMYWMHCSAEKRIRSTLCILSIMPFHDHF